VDFMAQTINGVKSTKAKSRKEWRKWLEKNSSQEKSVWLIIYHKKSKTKSVYYPEAVEEALCFGWIDSKPNKRDEESFYLYFAQRKKGSPWSKLNRDRVDKLIKDGLMTPAGQAKIDYAKKSGDWEALMKIEDETMPPELQKALNKNKLALKNFKSFPPSSRKIILSWVWQAKTDTTKTRRIEETVRLAAKNVRANHYKPK
jgi:uncharacterized protein YdeI (YjbR/CyaY-like superfamily)